VAGGGAGGILVVLTGLPRLRTGSVMTIAGGGSLKMSPAGGDTKGESFSNQLCPWSGTVVLTTGCVSSSTNGDGPLIGFEVFLLDSFCFNTLPSSLGTT
jgi:hypothetical protein